MKTRCNILLLFFCYTTRLFPQCTTDVQVTSNGTGTYTFTAISVSDTSIYTKYVWRLYADTIPFIIDSNTLQTSFTFDTNGTYVLCFFMSDTSTQCTIDTCFQISVTDAEYVPLLDSVNRWNYRGNQVPFLVNPNPDSRSYQCQYPNEGYGSGQRQYTEGDSLINSKRYKVLWSYTTWMAPCLFGFIREDTVLRKVYFIDNNSSPEILLYDFALKVGDTISRNFIAGSFFANGTYRVDSIRTISYNGVNRRTFFLNHIINPNSQTLIWIESIGNLGELVYPYSGNFSSFSFYGGDCPGFPHNFYQFLICFEHFTKVYYDDCAYRASLQYPQCVVVQDTCNYDGFCGAIDEIPSLSSFLISPNPASDNIVLELDVKQSNQFSIVLQNLEGRQSLSENNLGRLREGKHNIIIHLSNLNSGFYLVGCRTDEGTVYRKLVIQR